MKKYKISYQDDIVIKTIILETQDISKEDLPSNILNIKEIKKFNFVDLFENKKEIKEKN